MMAAAPKTSEKSNGKPCDIGGAIVKYPASLVSIRHASLERFAFNEAVPASGVANLHGSFAVALRRPRSWEERPCIFMVFLFRAFAMCFGGAVQLLKSLMAFFFWFVPDDFAIFGGGANRSLETPRLSGALCLWSDGKKSTTLLNFFKTAIISLQKINK